MFTRSFIASLFVAALMFASVSTALAVDGQTNAGFTSVAQGHWGGHGGHGGHGGGHGGHY